METEKAKSTRKCGVCNKRHIRNGEICAVFNYKGSYGPGKISFSINCMKKFSNKKSSSIVTKTELQVGNKVMIKNSDYNYSTYYKKFAEMGFKNPDLAKGIYNDTEKIKGVEFTIFSKNKHDETKAIIYGIEDENGNQFLFSKSGLRLI